MVDESCTASAAVTKSATTGAPVDGARRRIAALILMVLCALLFWRYEGTFDFWTNAWAQGTVFPDRPQAGSPKPVVFQRPDQSFDLRKTTIPAKRIVGGGPPKDGIPALTEPKLTPAGDASFLQPHPSNKDGLKPIARLLRRPVA